MIFKLKKWWEVQKEYSGLTNDFGLNKIEEIEIWYDWITIYTSFHKKKMKNYVFKIITKFVLIIN
jgi:hypothetical protein